MADWCPTLASACARPANGACCSVERADCSAAVATTNAARARRRAHDAVRSKLQACGADRTERKGAECVRTASDRRRRNPADTKTSVPSGLPSPRALLCSSPALTQQLGPSRRSRTTARRCSLPARDGGTRWPRSILSSASSSAAIPRRPTSLSERRTSSVATGRPLSTGQPRLASIARMRPSIACSLAACSPRWRSCKLLQSSRCCSACAVAALSRLTAIVSRPRSSDLGRRPGLNASLPIAWLSICVRPASRGRADSSGLLSGGQGDPSATLILRLLPTLAHPEPQQKFDASPIVTLRVSEWLEIPLIVEARQLLDAARSSALSSSPDARRAAFFASLVLHAAPADDHGSRISAAEVMILAASPTEGIRSHAIRALLPRDLGEQLGRATATFGHARVRNALNGLRSFLS